MGKSTRWGILGTGSICHRFAQELKYVRSARLVAVGSRTRKKAEAFADEFDVPHRHGTYEALAADADLDVIYIGTPHHLHCANTVLCLQGGKAVLCEKPFAINAAEAARMIRTARRRRLFLMEAMWSRFLPSVAKVRQLVGQGAIGELRMVFADFGFRAGVSPRSRLFAPSMGGGGLMDVGVYAVSLASMLLGRASKVVSLAEMCQTGVDGQAAAVIKYAGGQLALIATGVRTTTPQEAAVVGADGWIRLHAPWWAGGKLTVTTDKGVREIAGERSSHGFSYQVEAVGRCLAAGRLECDVMPLDESLAVMKTLDAIRAQWPLRYPMERKARKAVAAEKAKKARKVKKPAKAKAKTVRKAKKSSARRARR